MSPRSRTSAATSPTITPFSDAVPASTTTALGPTIADVISPGTPVAVTITLARRSASSDGAVSS